jgi:hypothetical protein
MRGRAVLGMAVPILLVAAVAFATSAGAKEGEVDAKAAIRTVMTKLYRSKGGISPGTPLKEGKAVLRSAAHLLQDHYLPLEHTPFTPGGNWTGVVRAWLDTDETDPMGTVTVVLRLPAVSKATVVSAIQATGKELGLTLEPDDQEPDTWFDSEEAGTSLWIGIGRDLVVFEFDRDVKPK